MINENKDFVFDLDGYNFDILINKGFSLDEVKELKRIYQNIKFHHTRKLWID